MLFEDRSLAPYQGTEPYLFLSYSHRNADSAAEAIRWLKAAGFRVWYDEGVIPATEWDENIAQAIENCDYLVALISEAYLASSNCLDELNYARDRNIPLLLIYLEDVALPSGLAMRLGRLLAIHRYRYDNPAAFYSKVVRAKGIGICGDGRFEAEEENEEDDTDPDAYWLDEDEEPVRRERASVFRPFFLILLALLVAGIAFLLLRGWAGERVHGIFGTGESTAAETLPAPDPTPYIPPEVSAEIEIEATPTPTPSASPEPSPTPSLSPDPTPVPTPTPLPSVTPYSDSTVVVVPDRPSQEPTPAPTPTPTPAAAEPEIVTPSPDEPLPVEPTVPLEVPTQPQETTAPTTSPESAEPTPTPTPTPAASPAA